MSSPISETAEHARLREDREGVASWRRWGPYLAERQWGTVREDYSADGESWEHFPHDQARSRAYRWGEDGLGGLCDDQQNLCLGVALWNERDPILKERLFGLTNPEGNHGEDVKELYWFLDATPTHSHGRMLYKYPQGEYPYRRLVEESARRTAEEPELELLDTGLFDEDRYFDVVIEHAKAAPEDLLLRVSVTNRGPDEARLHVLPQAWLRNTWSWGDGAPKPRMTARGGGVVEVSHTDLGEMNLHFEEGATLLACDNETNPRTWGGNGPGSFKDAFHDRVVHGRQDAVRADGTGTKHAAWHVLSVAPGATRAVRVRLARETLTGAFSDFDAVLERRREESDAFHAALQEGIDCPDARRVQRQALAGLLWSKQLYRWNVRDWLDGDPAQPPPPPERRSIRNSDWLHLDAAEVLSMPDTWEYPWFAAWDLAFHCIPIALVDPELAKTQLDVLTREWYLHPNGQLPAYEWALHDANPPVHAWAAWRVFQLDRKQRGTGDRAFLERVFHKLLLNFTWWVNRKDAEGRNLFQGGFLGLDNIGVFDRSKDLPTGGRLDQADGTSWMAMYCLNMLRIALELALEDHVYQDIATKFFEHFLAIAEAMSHVGRDGASLWDEQDGFFHDVLHLPDGRDVTLRVRSMVGLIPLFAVETLEPELLERVPDFRRRLEWLLEHRPRLGRLVSRWEKPGLGERRLLALLRGDRLKRVLSRMLDESEFLSDHGVRALSRRHLEEPYVFDCMGWRLSVRYEPGESTSGMFGGNSNWRGPVWFPVSYLLIESLQKFHHYHDDGFRVECPTGSGNLLTLEQVAEELTRRTCRLLLADETGRRPAHAGHQKLHADPHFRDHVLFHEYFHGDTGRGLGASHQTGWTALVAKMIQPRRREGESRSTCIVESPATAAARAERRDP